MRRRATARPACGPKGGSTENLVPLWLSRLGALCAAAALACAFATAARASDGDDGVLVISGSDEAFDHMHVVDEPGSKGQSVEDVIKQFFPDTVVHEGTYPLSEATEHNFDLRRDKPEQMTYNGRVFGKYSRDDISDTEKWEKEFELNLSYKQYDAFFRVSDVNAFNYKTEPFRLSKARVRYRWDDGKVTVGSFGTVFGRGLALNMFEERFLEFDNEAEGVLVEQKLGDASIQALYGTRKDIKAVAASTVSGVKLGTPLGDHVNVEAYAVNTEIPVPGDEGEPEPHYKYKLMGGNAQFRFGHFKTYAETVALKRDAVDFLPNNPFDTSGDDGHGFYATASYSIPGLALTGEYKHYRGLTQPFSVLPPIRRWQEKSQADPNDDEGYGFSMNWNPLGDGSFFNFGYGQDNSQKGGRPYSEFFGTYNSPSGQDFSYIAEYWQVLDFDQHHEITRLTLNQIIDEDWTATCFMENERLDSAFTTGRTDRIVEPELAYQSIANLIYRREMAGGDNGDNKSVWKLWELKLHPDDLTEIDILTGSRREGFVCSGGVCRQEPEFEGLRVDFTRRF